MFSDIFKYDEDCLKLTKLSFNMSIHNKFSKNSYYNNIPM